MIKAQPEESPCGGIPISDVLLSRAADLGADMIVAGAYHHSQLGGVSRDLLDHMTVPVTKVTALEHEMEGTNVGVTVLCPGPINTNIARGARNRPDHMGGPQIRVTFLRGMPPARCQGAPFTTIWM